MNPELLNLLVEIHHQLTTDADLENVAAPEKYRRLSYLIERQLINTEYAYLCTRYREIEALAEELCA